LSRVARHPVRVQRPLPGRGLLPRLADVHTGRAAGGSANRRHGPGPNPEAWPTPDQVRTGPTANRPVPYLAAWRSMGQAS
jgi:hypothetical protein